MPTRDPIAHDAVTTALAELTERDAPRRLWERDPSLFSDDPGVQARVAQRLGWLGVVDPPRDWSGRLESFTASVRETGIRRVLLCGMGGSSLAPEVIATMAPGAGLPLDVLDSTHPAVVRALLDDHDLSTTLVLVASKSGTTEETRCFAARAAALVANPNQLVAITDPGSELAEEAVAAQWRDVFLNPADIGGRYSALSFFGMLPAALVGAPTAVMWQRAREAAAGGAPARSVESDPAARLAAFMAGHARAGRDKLTLLHHPGCASLGDWIEQLVAESTGKDGTGIIPVVGEPAGLPEVYGDDRAFVELRFGGERAPGAADLEAAGLPLLSLDLRDGADLGAAFLQWELATAYAGVLLGVNPFDEPNVAESKRNTTEVLAEVRAGGPLPAPEHGEVGDLFNDLTAGDYLALQAYLPMTPPVRTALQALRTAVRDRLGIATTVGFGPRFLHSTGQLHKGGPPTVAALQVVDAPSSGPDIPGRPYDFATLVGAQALGDLRSLRDHDRRVVQVGAAAPGLHELVEAVERALG